MNDLIVELRFPAGSYLATAGHRGNAAEWPPMPERVAAAGLAGQAGMDTNPVDVLYALQAPMILAPEVHSPRNGRYERWVPRQTAKMKGKWDQKIAKVGDNSGVMVDPQTPVTMIWMDVGNAVDIEALQTAYARVSYLGRPTSPVVIDVRIDDGNAVLQRRLEDQRCQWYRPSDAGSVTLSVPSPQVLADRVAAWRVKMLQPRVNIPNVVVHREYAKYMVSRPDDKTTPTSRRSTYAQLVERGSWFPLPQSLPVDAAHAMAGSLRSLGAVMVYPAVVNDRLLGILAVGVGSTTTVEFTWANRVQRVAVSNAVSPKALHALGAYVSTSRRWTTAMPVLAGNRQEIVDAVAGMDTEAQVVDAAMHEEPLGPAMLWARPVVLSSHVTVMFDRPLRGPVEILGQALVPVSSVEDCDA